VASARVTRVLPHTLRVRIVEKAPAALVQAGTLRPATGAGEVLAVDPARGQVDLPLLAGAVQLDARGRVKSPAARAALAEAARLAEADPALMARVSEIRAGGGGELLLVLSAPAARVRLNPHSDAATLARLRAVLERLGRAAPGDSAAPAPLLDARYDDQVVVRPAG
jgi:cell division septal protein FtsQ